MARISFKAKARPVYNDDDTVAYMTVAVPTLTRSHCDMSAFRQHPKFGSYANSDLFPGMLAKIRRERITGSPYRDYVRLDQLPDGVAVDTSGFLAVVSIDV